MKDALDDLDKPWVLTAHYKMRAAVKNITSTSESYHTPLCHPDFNCYSEVIEPLIIEVLFSYDRWPSRKSMFNASNDRNRRIAVGLSDLLLSLPKLYHAWKHIFFSI